MNIINLIMEMTAKLCEYSRTSLVLQILFWIMRGIEPMPQTQKASGLSVSYNPSPSLYT